MKKITILIPDDEAFELSAGMMKNVIEFRMERIFDDKPKAARQSFRSQGTTTLKTIMDHYLAGGSFSRDRAIMWLTEKGFAKTSISPAISLLKKRGLIEEVERHKYSFLKPLD